MTAVRRPMRTLRPGEIRIEDVTGEVEPEAPPPYDPEVARMFAVADGVIARLPAARRSVGSLPRWLGAGLVALVAGAIGGIGGGRLMVDQHSATDSQRIIERIEKLET
jgi:hypothetical protein